MKKAIKFAILLAVLFGWEIVVPINQAEAAQILIHMKTSLAEDDAQICAVPNVAWAMTKAGHQVKILVDASAVTSVTNGFGWFNRMLFRSDSTALDRATLPHQSHSPHNGSGGWFQKDPCDKDYPRQSPCEHVGTGITDPILVFARFRSDHLGEVLEMSLVSQNGLLGFCKESCWSKTRAMHSCLINNNLICG